MLPKLQPCLGAALVLCLTVGDAIQIARSPMAPEQDEKDVVRALQDAGGIVVCDESIPSRPVINVDLYKSKSVTINLLKSLKRLPKLQSLAVSIHNPSVAAFKELSELKGICVFTSQRRLGNVARTSRHVRWFHCSGFEPV